MKQINLWFRCVVAGIMFGLLAAAELHGCTVSLVEVQVPGSFRVSVRHEQQSVPGIWVAVYDENDSHSSVKNVPLLRLITDKDGWVEIKGLRQGRYIVQTEGPGQGSAVYAIVSAHHKQAETEISLEWPFSWRGILKLKTLSGKLASNNPWMPFENIHLELWAAGASSPLATEDTGPLGHFDFNSSHRGIYILRIQGHQKDVNESNQVEGDLPVELSSSAPGASADLSLRLAMSSCGIEYSSCPWGDDDRPIVTAARRFQAIYGPGVRGEHPWIDNAKFKLLDDHGASIAEGRTDSKGMAGLPLEFQGRATLIVASSGLTSIRQSLDLLPADEGAPDLVVSLALLGASETGSECSAVNLEKHATP